MTALIMDRITGSDAPWTREAAASAQPDLSVRLHLTRRGRLLFIGIPLMAAAACLVFALGFFNSPATAASGDALQGTETVTYTVAPGDTVWRIANVVADEDDPRDVVQSIMDLNELETSTIHVGQQLFLPAGD